MLPQTRGSCSLCRVDSHDAQQVVSTYPQDHSLPRYHSEASGRAIISDPTGQAHNANPSDLSSCCRHPSVRHGDHPLTAEVAKRRSLTDRFYQV
jgi:hypothetical protein